MRTIHDKDASRDEVVFVEPIPYQVFDSLLHEYSGYAASAQLVRQELTHGSCRYLVQRTKGMTIGAIYLSAHIETDDHQVYIHKTYIRLMVVLGTEEETTERRQFMQDLMAVAMTYVDRHLKERENLPTIPRNPDIFKEVDQLGLLLEPTQTRKRAKTTREPPKPDAPIDEWLDWRDREKEIYNRSVSLKRIARKEDGTIEMSDWSLSALEKRSAERTALRKAGNEANEV